MSAARTRTKKAVEALTEPETVWYKVLVDGKACHGGSAAYSLPTGETPGEWMPPISGDLVVCSVGYHLTDAPQNWYRDKARIYVAEHRGGATARSGDKIAVRECRLLREADWAQFGVHVLTEGEHEIKSGVAYLSGNARAELLDNARAELRENASATLWGNASATLWDNASATLWDNASATLWGNARAELRENASATLWENATAISIPQHSADATVSLDGPMTAHVDRRGGKLTLRRGAA